MKEDINDINDLLGKYLAGEASENELKLAERWIAESENNKSYYDHLKLIFDRASAIKESHVFDADKAWIKMKSKLSEPKTKTILFPHFNIALRIAALLVITFGLGFLTYQWFNQPEETTSLVSTTEIIKDSLPDGTLAVLNKESNIQFISNRKERRVVLEGEAFFEVKHDENKQFIVEVNGLIIEDIGTSFNVKSIKGNPKVEVYVESGEVSIHSLSSERYTLIAGEAGTFDVETQLFSIIEKVDTNRLAYKTGIFNFRNVKMETILTDLNSVYNVKVKVRNEAINNCRLTVTFKNERIEDVVAIIAESLSLTVSKEGDEFVLDGIGCEN